MANTNVVILDLAHVARIKRVLASLLPHIKSCHRVEAMARGLGYNTYAGMRTDIADDMRLRKISNEAFSAYLASKGFAVDGNNLLSTAIAKSDLLP